MPPHRILSLALLVSLAASLAADEPVDFGAQIKPLLSDRCFLCHGPDAETRQADLRLDSEKGLTAPLASDEALRAVVPGKPDQSQLVARILSSDPDVQMPPPDSGLKLSDAEKRRLTQWVKEGANWEGHWAFEPIISPEPPAVRNNEWIRNNIDRFVVARQEAAGLAQNSAASKERLLRRVTFDLTGLPPSLEEIDAFLADDSSNAFEKVVDRLLASEHFGERMAAQWLDVARYSDTYGYQVDRDRYVWPWRDWVVEAFNGNMPHNRFITEQLAGDMLPEATREQRLATTFNRLHPQKVEGGSVPEEFRVEYVADRTQTMATAFMGLTLECCRCHDHKYDPISQKEYYQLFSYFNTIDEAGLYSYFTNSVPTPTLRLPNEGQQKQLHDAAKQVAEAEKALAARLTELSGNADLLVQLKAASSERIADPLKLIPGQVDHQSYDSGGVGGNRLVESPRGSAVQLTGDHGVGLKVGNFPRYQPFSISLWIKTETRFERCVVLHRSRAWTDSASRGYELLIEDGRLSAALIHFWPGNAVRVRTVDEVPLGEWAHVTITWDGSSAASGLKLWFNGQPAPTSVIQDKLYKNITGSGGDNITIGQRFRDRGFKGGLVDELRVYNRELTAPEIAHLGEAQSFGDRLKGELKSDAGLTRYAAATLDEEYGKRLAALQSARQAYCKLQDGLPEIMVMEESQFPRQAWLLTRGDYNKREEKVASETPAFLPPRTAAEPGNRLGLARWLTSDVHPLTARVAVNRFWQICFANGLVRTPEDFGSQGQAPTHPALLDWLASDFRSHGWDVKRLMKQLVMSATYQQQSVVSTEVREMDPENKLLTRAPVVRLTAEMLRDNALAVSGLLHRNLGGAPVRPYELAASFKPSNPDKGAGLYRRSLYTYWKRTAPAPVMMTLDASKREVCRVKRERTASPLQVLVLMNGPQFVEAARMLADRLLVTHGENDEAVLSEMFRVLTGSAPRPDDREIVARLFEEQRLHFGQHADAAEKYLGVGEAKPKYADRIRLAAWASVANTLFAFDECIMKR